MSCFNCHKECEGGIYTNGDGHGDAKHVGIDAGSYRHYCWDCQEAATALGVEVNSAIDAAFQERGWCGFLEAWRGRCRNPKPCAEHHDQRCWLCKEPAVRNCDHTGILVCGMPECAKHPHRH